MQTATRTRKQNPFASGGPVTANKLFTTTINNQEVDICRTNLSVRPFEARANGKAVFSGYVTRDGKTIEFYQKHTYTVVARFDAETFEPILDINDFPVSAPAMAQDIVEGCGSSAQPSDYEIACQAEREAEYTYWREWENPKSVNYSQSLMNLQEARRIRAAAALAEVKARGAYAVLRISFADGSATVMRAPEALAMIRNEWLETYDVAADDKALRVGLTVHTFEARYDSLEVGK